MTIYITQLDGNTPSQDSGAASFDEVRVLFGEPNRATRAALWYDDCVVTTFRWIIDAPENKA